VEDDVRSALEAKMRDIENGGRWAGRHGLMMKTRTPGRQRSQMPAVPESPGMTFSLFHFAAVSGRLVQ
jgi:hypothetical protein